jgi:hypothetical protein
VDGFVSDNGFALSADLSDVATSGAWSDLTGVPADADTQLTEVEVDAFADNNGYAQSSDIFGGTWSDIVGIPADIADGDDDTLGGLSCMAGQVPVFYALTSQWLCDTPPDTTLTEAEVDNFANNNGYALSADLAPVATTGDWYDLVNVPADLTDGNLLADISCLDGEILVWDGLALAWTCGLDQDSVLTEAEVDAFVDNNGYITDADTFSGDWNDLINVPVDIDDGDADTLADISCSATQVAKWNGAGWACADDIDTDTVLDEADVDAFVSDNGYASASDIFSGVFSDLTGVPADEDTLGMLVCPDEQVAVATGGGWICGDNHDGSAAEIAALIDRIEALELALSEGGAELSSGIYEGDYIINSSADISYLAGYTEINGNLLINTGLLIDLSGLENIETVTGDLTISENGLLVTLDGLNGVTTIHGDLKIHSNASLVSLQGLENLVQIGMAISIHSNELLENFEGVSSLTDAQFLDIRSNPMLLSFDGLEGITRLVNIQVWDNESLMSTSGLESLTTVVEYVSINNNFALTNLGWSNLNTIGTFLYIENNGITSINLSSLVSVGDYISLAYNDNLASINLESLISVGDYLSISRHLALTSIYLENLASVGNYFEIGYNEPLINIGLENLISVVGNFNIHHSDALLSINIDKLVSVGEGLNIHTNLILPSFGSVNLTTVGSLNIYDNSALSTLELNSLTSAGEDLYIWDNDSLCQSLVDAFVTMVESSGWSGSQYTIGNDNSC